MSERNLRIQTALVAVGLGTLVITLFAVGLFIDEANRDQEFREARSICRPHGGIYSFLEGSSRVACNDGFEVNR